MHQVPCHFKSVGRKQHEMTFIIDGAAIDSGQFKPFEHICITSLASVVPMMLPPKCQR